MTEFRPSHPGDIPQLRQLWKDCFGDSDEFLDLFFSTAYTPERSLVITETDRILGAAYWFDCTLDGRTLAYLYAIAVSPHFQNQGLGSALMESIHAALRLQGYDAAILIPGEESLRRYYSRFGYRTCSYRYQEVRLPSLTPVSPAQYARLRRTLMPENGVIQEGEALAFLAALADFYRGENAIAVLSKEDGTCLELLGVPPVGTRIPYAMGLSLTSAPLPEEIYFAFGFN